MTTGTSPNPSRPSLWRQLKPIFSLATPYRWKIAGCLVLILLASAIQLSLPLGIRALIDEMLTEQSRRLLNLLAGGLLILFVFRSALAYVGSLVLNIVGDRIVANLRCRLMDKFQELDLKYHNDQQVGDLSSRLGSDTASLREAITDSMVASILQAFQLMGSVAIMFLMNWRLSLIVVLVAPAASIVSRLYSGTFQRLAVRYQDLLARSTAVAQESLAAILQVKVFARGAFESRRYSDTVEEVYDVSVDTRKAYSLFNALVNLIISSSTIAIFWYGGLEVIGGRLTAGELVAFLLYSQGLSGGISVLTQQHAALNRAVGSSRRVFDILRLEPEIRQRVDASPLPDQALGIRFEDVSFSYVPDQPVLRDVSFEVEPGQTVALVGPSGAGKSSLLNLIPRLYDPVAGRLLVAGRDVRDYDLTSLREQIAIVSQEVFLFGASVRDNIRYGRLAATDEEIEAAAREANAHEFIEQLPEGYDTQVGERGVKLSGGQRQRLSIARALLRQGRILILDEATSSVDTTSEALIQEALERLRRERTTFVIAHRLSTVRNADRILVLEDGEIRESGNHDTLLSEGGLYHQLVNTQFQAAAA